MFENNKHFTPEKTNLHHVILYNEAGGNRFWVADNSFAGII